MIRSDLQNLAKRIAEIEQKEHSGCQVARLDETPSWADALLGGHLAGALVELLTAEEGAGAWTLALFMARHVCGERKILVVADDERRFYPPAASRLHIDLRRTIVIRPKKGQPALAALTQSLRCAAVGAALGKLDRLSTTDCRRLQVAAESGGGVGFLLRPAAVLNMPSFAAIRLLVAPLPLAPSGVASAYVSGVRHVQVEIVRFRGSLTSQGGRAQRRAPLVLEIDDEKGHVRISTWLAAAKPSAPPPRVSR